VIAMMGDKSEAKRAMTAAGVPVAPGSDGAVADADEALAVARRVGFPVMVKASAGGGGKGMRIARGEDQLRSGFAMASAEAQAAFGNGALYVEKFIESPKHIEIQVMGDGKGGAIHLGERDCSIQRRHQKLIEEAPGPLVDPKLREAMGKAAVEACQRLNYRGAGTIEFLVEGSNFYFMEMNTRIQVEHTVTEEITGIDLIEEMMRAAAGLPLSVRQEDVEFRGCAIECRINAEDPARNFMPTPGRLTAWHPPGGPGIRLDSHCYQEYLVPSHYDSMLGKLIAWAPTRARAIARMRRALDEFVVEGVKTTIPFHKRVLDSAAFRDGTFGVDFVERHILSAP
jgi:acetyl-CoA carboxylase biotin carboxylase subunit